MTSKRKSMTELKKVHKTRLINENKELQMLVKTLERGVDEIHRSAEELQKAINKSFYGTEEPTTEDEICQEER